MQKMFAKKLIQAPLAGYSCAAFRVLAEQWGKPDFCYSEMLSAQHIASGARLRKRYVYKAPQEGRLCVQLAGDHAETLINAAQQAITWGANLIDLNCGCPQPKIRRKNLGSRLLDNSEHLYELVSRLRATIDVPLLVKIRISQHNHTIAQAIQAAGADAITVHGRHWTQDYTTPVNYAAIAEIKAAVTIPVIGNGDVCDTASAKRMFDETGCDAVMIARASVGQPWLFEKIYQELQGNHYEAPTLTAIGNIFLAHVRGLIELEGEKIALLQSRKLGKYYASAFQNIHHIHSYAQLEAFIHDQYTSS